MELPPVEKGGHLPLPEFESSRPKRGRPRKNQADTISVSDFLSSGPRPVQGKAATDAQIREGLTRYYSLGGLLLARFDPTGYDSTVVMAMAEKCADGWIEVGHEQPAVYNALKIVTAQNSYVDLVFAHMAIGIGLAANHGIVPPGWVVPFSLPVPQPQAAQAAQAPMGMPEAPLGFASPLDVPVMPQNPSRVDASLTGEGLGQVLGMTPVEFGPDIMETIKRQALEQALVEQAIAAAQQQAAVTGVPGYNPVDTAPRSNQNPAILSRLVQRRA